MLVYPVDLKIHVLNLDPSSARSLKHLLGVAFKFTSALSLSCLSEGGRVIVFSYTVHLSIHIFLSICLVFVLLWLLVEHAHELGLQCFLVFIKPVLLPGEIQHFRVHFIPRHAVFKPCDTLFVIRFLFEFERSAVFHVLLKFGGKASAELVEARFYLLLLYSGVFFILGASWQSLPR